MQKIRVVFTLYFIKSYYYFLLYNLGATNQTTNPGFFTSLLLEPTILKVKFLFFMKPYKSTKTNYLTYRHEEKVAYSSDKRFDVA